MMMASLCRHHHHHQHPLPITIIIAIIATSSAFTFKQRRLPNNSSDNNKSHSSDPNPHSCFNSSQCFFHGCCCGASPPGLGLIWILSDGQLRVGSLCILPAPFNTSGLSCRPIWDSFILRVILFILIRIMKVNNMFCCSILLEVLIVGMLMC